MEKLPVGTHLHRKERPGYFGTSARRREKRMARYRTILEGGDIHNDQPISSFMISFVPA